MTEAANKLTTSAALPMKAVTGRCKGEAAGATPLEGEIVANRLGASLSQARHTNSAAEYTENTCDKLAQTPRLEHGFTSDEGLGRRSCGDERSRYFGYLWKNPLA